MNLLGVLAGMSVLHLIVILGINDTSKLWQIYSPFAKNTNMVFIIIANICLALCYAI